MPRVAPLPHRGLYEVEDDEDDERREGYESGASARLRRAFLASCCCSCASPQSSFPVARHSGSAAAAAPAVSETPANERPRRYSPSPSRVVPAPAGPPILVAQASTSYRAFRAFQFRGGNNSGAFAVEEEGEEALASLQVGNGAPGERSMGN